MEAAAARFDDTRFGGEGEQQRLVMFARPVLDIPKCALRGTGHGIDTRGIVDRVGGGDFESGAQWGIPRLTVLIADLISGHGLSARVGYRKPSWTCPVSQDLDLRPRLMNG